MAEKQAGVPRPPREVDFSRTVLLGSNLGESMSTHAIQFLSRIRVEGSDDPRFPCVRHSGAMVWRNGLDPDEAHRLLALWVEL
jgi:hypothetical protein